MDDNTVDYNNLKKRGFLKSRFPGLFTLRTRTSAANYDVQQLLRIADIAQRYGRGFVHATVRQGLEVPFIRYEDIPVVENELAAAGVKAGTSGPRLRATTCCPGSQWCSRGLVDPSVLFRRIEEELGMECGMELPHKFKIVLSGCPNACTRAEGSEIGLHGAVIPGAKDRCYGYMVYVGGCGGKTPHAGIKLEKVFAEDEVLVLIPKIVNFFKQHARPRQRLALLIREYGVDKFLALIQ